MSTIKGKALLVITRLHEADRQPRYDVHAFIQSCSGSWEHRDAAQEEFQHLHYDVLPLPAPAYRLVPGETLRVHVVFEFSYSQDYYGEADVDLDYHKTRVLRRQKPHTRYSTLRKKP